MASTKAIVAGAISYCHHQEGGCSFSGPLGHVILWRDGTVDSNPILEKQGCYTYPENLDTTKTIYQNHLAMGGNGMPILEW